MYLNLISALFGSRFAILGLATTIFSNLYAYHAPVSLMYGIP
ncbi:MAG: hypothetical protein QXT53_02450 [Ignisphaera sp.]